MFYSEEKITEVREANDIVDVIGQYVKLDKKGANYFGLCPFHGEKTASFSVNPRKQICYCFGCHKGGNVINFVMEYEHMTYPEAIRHLADRAHIRLPEVQETENDRKYRQHRERLLDLNKDAAYFYHDKLNTPEGEQGLKYFREKRKLSKNTVIHFGLGYAGKTPGELSGYLRSKGYADDELRDSGLITIDEKGYKDKFWNRVMFPIMDINSKVIGFGGRVMGDALPKYLNSPETPIFNKSQVLYGLNFARRSKENFILLCEGYMDVISLHQAGFTNAVACLGTALTENHARLLKRYTDLIVLTQDSDSAGLNAKIRSFPILYSAGLKVNILDMGAYKDPDEFIKANGPDAYRDCIKKSKNAFLYIVNALKDRYDMSDPASRTEYYNDIAARLTMFSDQVERDSYIQSVSVEQMIKYDDLKYLVDKHLMTPGKYLQTSERPETFAAESMTDVPAEKKDTKTEHSENILLYWMIQRPEIIDPIFSILKTDDFTDGVRRTIAEHLLAEKESFNASAFFDSLESGSDECSTAGYIIIGDKEISESEKFEEADLSKFLSQALRNVYSYSINRKIRTGSYEQSELQELFIIKKSIPKLKLTL